MAYCYIRENMEFVHSIDDLPAFFYNADFGSGESLDLQYKLPCIVDVDVAEGDTPCHFFDGIVPIFSKELISIFVQTGIANFQVFPITLRSKETGVEWSEYYAFNVLKSTESIDIANFEYKQWSRDVEKRVAKIMEENDGYKKTQGPLMLRSLISPSTILFNTQIVDILRKIKPKDGGGWRITIDYID